MSLWQQISTNNRYLALGLSVYLITLAYWSLVLNAPLNEVLFLGGILGLGFSLLAIPVTRRTKPIGSAPASGAKEPQLLLAYIAFVAMFLGLGPGYGLGTAFDTVGLSIAEDLVKLLEKLIVFVLLPWLLFVRLPGRSLLAVGLPAKPVAALTPNTLVVFLIFVAAFTLIQVFFSRHWGTFASEAAFSAPFILGLLFSYIWLFVEVGLVEEFFFRAIVQDRIAVQLKSPVAGLVIGALVFSLAHVPGLYFRSFEGGQPFDFVISYVVLILAPTSLVFGVIWMRTRNLLLLMAIHASVDLIPNQAHLSSLIGL